MCLLSLTGEPGPSPTYTVPKLLGTQWTSAPGHDSFHSPAIRLLVQPCLHPQGCAWLSIL